MRLNTYRTSLLDNMNKFHLIIYSRIKNKSLSRFRYGLIWLGFWYLGNKNILIPIISIYTLIRYRALIRPKLVCMLQKQNTVQTKTYYDSYHMVSYFNSEPIGCLIVLHFTVLLSICVLQLTSNYPILLWWLSYKYRKRETQKLFYIWKLLLLSVAIFID